jgi:hypothetical protein
MATLYGVKDELPADIADAVLDDDKPVGPPGDENTATAELEDDE